MSRNIHIISIIALIAACAGPTAADTMILHPDADTFLSEFSPDNNLGAVTNFAAGTVSNGTRTRALLRFDIASRAPEGATISSVSLQLQATRANAGGGANSTFALRRVLRQWNEGSKGGGNLGAAATAGETSWNQRISSGTSWTTPGGAFGSDFAGNASASLSISGLGPYVFTSSAGLVEDVQLWLENPEINFGWVLLTESEGVSETARRFASREDSARSPMLIVEYALD